MSALLMLVVVACISAAVYGWFVRSRGFCAIFVALAITALLVYFGLSLWIGVPALVALALLAVFGTLHIKSVDRDLKSEANNRVAISGVVVVAVMAVCVLIGSTGAFAHNSNNDSTVAEATSSPESDSATDAQNGDAPEQCTDGFVVNLDENTGGDLISGGISADPDQARNQVADAAHHDPRVLQVYYNGSPLAKVNGPIDDVTDIAPLKDGSCYTERGVEMYNDWSTLWNVADIDNGDLPEHGVNTGATPNGNAFQAEGTIPDGTGLTLQYMNATDNNVGTPKYIRAECGNLVTSSPSAGTSGPPSSAPPIVHNPTPSQPPVSPPPPPPTETTTPPPPTETTTPPPPTETTTPPPPTETTTPPPPTETTTPPPPTETTTPPPPTTTTVKPKDDDPSAYPYPTGKSSVPAPPSDEGEETPPVEDNPAKPDTPEEAPIDQDQDVTAPGAEDPEPSRKTPAPIDQAPPSSDPGNSGEQGGGTDGGNTNQGPGGNTSNPDGGGDLIPNAPAPEPASVLQNANPDANAPEPAPAPAPVPEAESPPANGGEDAPPALPDADSASADSGSSAPATDNSGDQETADSEVDIKYSAFSSSNQDRNWLAYGVIGIVLITLIGFGLTTRRHSDD